MNFVIIITEHDGDEPPEAMICAEYQAANVVAHHREYLTGPGDRTYSVPASCHWSAEVRHPTTPEDIDGIERW